MRLRGGGGGRRKGYLGMETEIITRLGFFLFSSKPPKGDCAASEYNFDLFRLIWSVIKLTIGEDCGCTELALIEQTTNLCWTYSDAGAKHAVYIRGV